MMEEDNQYKYDKIYIAGGSMHLICMTCSAVIFNQRLHTDWHKKNDKRPYGKVRYKNGRA